MCKKLKTRYFFKKTPFPELFENIDFVWEALTKIKDFIDTKTNNKNVIIGDGTIIEAGAVIQGPAIIGKNCKIRSGSYIRGGVIIGDNCTLRSEIKNSIIMDNSNAAHLSYIGDSIIGSNCNLGASTILSNLKLGENNVNVRVGEKRYKTNLKKFGAIIGDNTHTGCNVVANPGTLVGKNCNIYSNTVLRGFYKSNQIIKLRQNVDICEKK